MCVETASNQIYTVPCSPHEFPKADVMKLWPLVLRLPRFLIPLSCFFNVSVHKIETSLEKQKPCACWVLLLNQKFLYDSYIKFERTYLGNGNFYAYLELFVENCPAEFDVTLKVAFDVDQHKVVSQQGHCAQYLPNAVLQLISLFQLLQSNFLKKSFSVKSSRWQFLHCIPCFQKSP